MTARLRGLSLLEVVVTMAIMSLLVGVGAVAVSAIRAGNALQESALRLETVRLEARAAVTDESFPADVTEFSSTSIPVVAEQPGVGQVSAHVPQADTVVLATWAGDSCLVVIETLGAAPRWGRRDGASSCTGESLWLASAQVTGTRASPTVVS